MFVLALKKTLSLHSLFDKNSRGKTPKKLKCTQKKLKFEPWLIRPLKKYPGLSSA